MTGVPPGEFSLISPGTKNPGQVNRSADVDRWRDTIQSISSFSMMGQCCFLYQYLLEGEKGRPVEANRFEDGRFVLDAGETYTAKVCQYVIYGSELSKEIAVSGSSDALKSPIPLDLVVDEDLILPIMKKATVVGRYEELQFSFRPRTGVEEQTTNIEIKTSRKSVFHIANTFMEIKIQNAPWQWGAMASGIGLYLFAFMYVEQVNSVISKLLEAVAIFLISSLGKDFYISLLKRIARKYRNSDLLDSESSD